MLGRAKSRRGYARYVEHGVMAELEKPLELGKGMGSLASGILWRRRRSDSGIYPLKWMFGRFRRFQRSGAGWSRTESSRPSVRCSASDGKIC